MLLNTLLLIISSLLATTNAQCPIAWWPMSYFSNSINFFTEVMRGNNIGFMDADWKVLEIVSILTPYGLKDRVGTNSARSISFLPGAVQNMQVNPDYYFCGAFTVTLWLNPLAATIGVIFDFKDSTLANGYQLQLNAAGTGVILISSATGTTAVTNTGATTLTIGATTLAGVKWNFVAITFSGVTGTFPSFYNGLNSAPSSAQSITPVAINTPVCNQMSRSFIGNQADLSGLSTNTGFSGSLNDLKIYNYQMSLAQVAARFTAEQSSFRNN